MKLTRQEHPNVFNALIGKRGYYEVKGGIMDSICPIVDEPKKYKISEEPDHKEYFNVVAKLIIDKDKLMNPDEVSWDTQNKYDTDYDYLVAYNETNPLEVPIDDLIGMWKTNPFYCTKSYSQGNNYWFQDITEIEKITEADLPKVRRKR